MRAKKMTALAMAVFMCFCLFAAVAAKQTGETTSAVNVRVGPSSSGSSVVKKLVKGTELTVTLLVKKGETVDKYKADMDFYKLETGGYVAAKYIKITSTVTDESDELSDANILDESDQFDNADIIDETQADEDTQLDGLIAIDDETNIAEETNTQSQIVANDTVNVRTGPGTGYTKLKRMMKGAKATATKLVKEGAVVNEKTVVGNWYKIETGGYVSADYVKLVSKPISKKLSAGDGVLANTNVNMRKGPGTSYSKVRLMMLGETSIIKKLISSGTTLNSKQVSGDWAQLNSGYVKLEYLSLDKDNA